MSFADGLDIHLLGRFIEEIKKRASVYDAKLFQWFFMNQYQDFLEKFKEEVYTADDSQDSDAPGLDNPNPEFPYWLEKVEAEIKKVEML